MEINSIDIIQCDSFPFGMLMPNRHENSSQYRFGFNGMEKDDEVKGQGAQYDYGFRIYDPRIAKFLSVDPLTASYPWYTPYQFAGNKPIWAVDLDGLEEYYASDGQLIGKYGTSTEVRIVYDEYIRAALEVTSEENKDNPLMDILNVQLYNEGSAGVFNNTDDAATDWGARYNKKSIDDNLEYSSFIFYTKLDNGDNAISYTIPVKGSKSSAAETSFTFYKNRKLAGYIHSHGAYDPAFKSNMFSSSFYDNKGNFVDGDINSFKKMQPFGVNAGYVTTPNGSLLKYYFGNIFNLRQDMPSDSYDPDTCPDTDVIDESNGKAIIE